MIFRPELAKKVLDGEKTETRRPVNIWNENSPWFVQQCRYKVGPDYALQDGRGKHAIGRIRLVEPPHKEELGALTLAGARREGFENTKAFRDYFRGLHRGEFDPEDIVWVIRFKLISVSAVAA